jgi:hypothetical protein
VLIISCRSNSSRGAFIQDTEDDLDDVDFAALEAKAKKVEAQSGTQLASPPPSSPAQSA